MLSIKRDPTSDHDLRSVVTIDICGTQSEYTVPKQSWYQSGRSGHRNPQPRLVVVNAAIEHPSPTPEPLGLFSWHKAVNPYRHSK